MNGRGGIWGFGEPFPPGSARICGSWHPKKAGMRRVPVRAWGAQVGAEELSRKLGIFGFFGARLAGWRRAGRALAAAVVSGCRFWWWILIFPCFPQFWLLPCEPEGEAAVAGVYFDCKNRGFFPSGAGCCGPKENKRNESFNIWFLCSVWC